MINFLSHFIGEFNDCKDPISSMCDSFGSIWWILANISVVVTVISIAIYIYKDNVYDRDDLAEYICLATILIPVIIGLAWLLLPVAAGVVAIIMFCWVVNFFCHLDDYIGRSHKEESKTSEDYYEEHKVNQYKRNLKNGDV